MVTTNSRSIDSATTASVTTVAGFGNSVFDSQATFRALLNGLAHPGQVFEVPVSLAPPVGLDLATAATCLTLFDLDVTVWLQPGIDEAVGRWLGFHCGCQITQDLTNADFAVVVNPDEMPKLREFRQGEPETPEHSTTIVMQVPGFSMGQLVTLRGPGIEVAQTLQVSGVSDEFWVERRSLTADYPLGIDVLFCGDRQIVGLPRTSVIEIQESTSPEPASKEAM